MAELIYEPIGRTRFRCVLTTQDGSSVMLELGGSAERIEQGDAPLRANAAVVENTWAFGLQEHEFRRVRTPAKRDSHRKRADAHRETALGIAEMVHYPGERFRDAWCSACFAFTRHQSVSGRWRVSTPSAYLCSGCGAPTTPCAAPRCAHMANRRTARAGLPRYCAEHRHEIHDFSRSAERLKDLGKCESFLQWRSRNFASATRVGLAAVLVGSCAVPAAWLAAPAIGGALGASVLGGGLSGAAATSHGLAMLGLGSLAGGGFGMAGGTVVVAAAGAGLGASLGAASTAAYVRDDPSFKIEKLKDGIGDPVIVASGFLSEGATGWGPWRELIERRWPDRPVYRVIWGAKELKALGAFLVKGAAQQSAAAAAKALAMTATKAGASKIPYLNLPLLLPTVAANPWTVALSRSEKTAAVVADLLARTEGDSFVLVGHSLGARVMLQTAELLATSKKCPVLESVHLVGAAVSVRRDWHLVGSSVSTSVWNYHSKNDAVLNWLYRYAQFKGVAAGANAIPTSIKQIRNVDVSKTVDSHDAYYEGIRLR